MPVICPKCQRPLSSLKQSHYCAKVDIDSLFERKEDIVLQLFDRLLEIIAQWPGVEFSATKACIVFITVRSFLVLKPMKKALDMHFALAEPQEEEFVYKCMPYGGRYIHYIRLQQEADLNRDVLRLIRMAYDEEAGKNL